MNTIKQQWQSYEKDVLPQHISAVQRQETRRAFYAGAQGMMTINKVVSQSSVSDEAGEKILEGCQEEIRNFVQDILNGEA